MTTPSDDEDDPDGSGDWLDRLLEGGDPSAPVDDILDADPRTSQRIRRRRRNRPHPDDGPDE